MKKTINILLAITAVVPIVLLFWPFAQWNDIEAVILRVISSLAVQILLCRIAKRNIIKAIPAMLTGVFAAWGTYLYFTSQHWSNATFEGLVADYISPFICCIIVLIDNLLMKEKLSKKDIIFRIFSTICIFLSVYVFSLLRQLTGDPTTKMFTDILIIFLLVVLNTAVLVLYEIIKGKRN